MTFEAFCAYYEKNGSCPGDVAKRQRVRPLNEKELKRRWEARQRSASRSRVKAEEKAMEADPDDQTRKDCWARDGGACRLRTRLGRTGNGGILLMALRDKAGPLLDTLDMAHVFGKGSNPHMRHDLDNVVLLNRYSHSMLDQGKHPIYGTPISAQEKTAWWSWIVYPSGAYDQLLARSKTK